MMNANGFSSGGTAAAKLIEARTGYANYYFNRFHRDRIWSQATKQADYAALNGAYLEVSRGEPPARATLAVSALPRPAARVEIKCSAVIARR